MHIQIEEQIITRRDFESTKSRTGRFYVVSQPALMFKEGSKYPDKFDLTLVFSSDKSDSDQAAGLPNGTYVLTDKAFYLDRNRNPQCNFSELKLINSDQQQKAS